MINPELKIGDRVVMLHMDGEIFTPGVAGTVTRISNVFGNTQYSVKWDNGSQLQILSDVDKWISESDWEKLNNRVGNITESVDYSKYLELLNNYNVGKLFEFLSELRSSGVVNMFQSSPYLWMGKERIAHEHHYDDTNEHFDNVLEMADEVKNIMISGAMKVLNEKDIELSIENIQRQIKKSAQEMLLLIMKSIGG